MNNAQHITQNINQLEFNGLQKVCVLNKLSQRKMVIRFVNPTVTYNDPILTRNIECPQQKHCFIHSLRAFIRFRIVIAAESFGIRIRALALYLDKRLGGRLFFLGDISKTRTNFMMY